MIQLFSCERPSSCAGWRSESEHERMLVRNPDYSNRAEFEMPGLFHSARILLGEINSKVTAKAVQRLSRSPRQSTRCMIPSRIRFIFSYINLRKKIFPLIIFVKIRQPYWLLAHQNSSCLISLFLQYLPMQPTAHFFIHLCFLYEWINLYIHSHYNTFLLFVEHIYAILYKIDRFANQIIFLDCYFWRLSYAWQTKPGHPLLVIITFIFQEFFLTVMLEFDIVRFHNKHKRLL